MFNIDWSLSDSSLKNMEIHVRAYLSVVLFIGPCVFCPIGREVIFAQDQKLIFERINCDSEEEQLAAISTIVEMQRQIRGSSKRLYEIACDQRQSGEVRKRAIDAIGALTIPFALDQFRVGGYSEAWAKKFATESAPLSSEESSIATIVRNPAESVELRVAAMEMLTQSAMKYEHVAIPGIVASILRDETHSEALRIKAAECLCVRTTEPALVREALSDVLGNNKAPIQLREQCLHSLVGLAMLNGSDSLSVKASVSALEGVSFIAQNPQEPKELRKAALDWLFKALLFPGVVREPARQRCLESTQSWTMQLMNDVNEDQELRDAARSLHKIAEQKPKDVDPSL